MFNVTGVIITPYYKTDGLYLPPNDRCHDVAWSDLTVKNFYEGYWNKIWAWYYNGGDRHVAVSLAARDISLFNPKAPPPKTEAFWAIAISSRIPEEGELAHVLDQLGNPEAVTLEQITDAADLHTAFHDWIIDRKNRRAIPHRLEKCGYVPVRNSTRDDGLWGICGRRQVVCAKSHLTISQQSLAATALQRRLEAEASEAKTNGAEPFNNHGRTVDQLKRKQQ